MPGRDITFEETLPNSIESERAILGAIILDHKAIFPATEVLTIDDFYLEGHREIFRAMLALAEEETSIDLFTLREELRRRGREEAAGGPVYIAMLSDGLPSGLNVGHYAKTVREKATARQLIQLSNELMCRCYEGEERPAAILEKTEARIFQIASREIKGGFQPARELADVAYKEIEEAAKHKGPVSGIDTGFIELNRMTGGFHNQNLVVVAARPGIGKTSFCLNIATRAAIRDGKHIGIFSLEMSKPEIMKQMIAAVAEVDSHLIQSGYLSREDWSRVPLGRRPSSPRRRSSWTTPRT